MASLEAGQTVKSKLAVSSTNLCCKDVHHNNLVQRDKRNHHCPIGFYQKLGVQRFPVGHHPYLVELATPGFFWKSRQVCEEISNKLRYSQSGAWFENELLASPPDVGNIYMLTVFDNSLCFSPQDPTHPAQTAFTEAVVIARLRPLKLGFSS